MSEQATAVSGATFCVPARGSVGRTALAVRVVVLGPGAGLLLAGPALVLGGAGSLGWLLVAAALTIAGSWLWYLGAGRLSSERLQAVIEECRSAGVATWAGMDDAVDRVQIRERRDEPGR